MGEGSKRNGGVPQVRSERRRKRSETGKEPAALLQYARSIQKIHHRLNYLYSVCDENVTHEQTSHSHERQRPAGRRRADTARMASTQNNASNLHMCGHTGVRTRWSWYAQAFARNDFTDQLRAGGLGEYFGVFSNATNSCKSPHGQLHNHCGLSSMSSAVPYCFQDLRSVYLSEHDCTALDWATLSSRLARPTTDANYRRDGANSCSPSFPDVTHSSIPHQEYAALSLLK